MNQSILFIASAGQTASSTLLGMLNCHPDIFLFYETDLYKSLPSKYAKRFLETYPDARYFMGYYDDIGAPYKLAKDFLSRKGYEFKIVGDKIDGLDYNFDKLKKYKVIFIIRDIKTWLRKEGVASMYTAQKDIIPTVADYLAYFLHSFLLPDVLRIRTEDIIQDNQGVINKISDFLGMELNLGKWWEKIDKQGYPKKAQRWWEGHASSLVEPKKLDVKIEIKSHVFWDSILPIFNKYYQNLEKHFSEEEISQDLEELKKLGKMSPVSLASIYGNYWKDKLIPKDNKISANKKLKHLIRKCLDKLYYETSKLLR